MMDAKQLPGFWVSVAPIFIPIILILLKTVLGFVGISNSVVDFLGSPIVALGIGTLLAIYGLVPKEDNKAVLKMMDDAYQRYRYHHADHRCRRISWKLCKSKRYRYCTW